MVYVWCIINRNGLLRVNGVRSAYNSKGLQVDYALCYCQQTNLRQEERLRRSVKFSLGIKSLVQPSTIDSASAKSRPGKVPATISPVDATTKSPGTKSVAVPGTTKKERRAYLTRTSPEPPAKSADIRGSPGGGLHQKSPQLASFTKISSPAAVQPIALEAGADYIKPADAPEATQKMNLLAGLAPSQIQQIVRIGEAFIGPTKIDG